MAREPLNILDAANCGMAYESDRGPEVAQLRQLPDPEPGDGDAAFRVAGAGVSHAKVWTSARPAG